MKVSMIVNMSISLTMMSDSRKDLMDLQGDILTEATVLTERTKIV